MAINPIDPGGYSLPPTGIAQPASGQPAGGGFSRIIDQFLTQATVQNQQVDQALGDLLTGKTNDVHNLTLAVARADLTFRMILEIRNRLTEAFQEISRMQI